MKKAGVIHLFQNGHTEVGTGKPGFRWVNAYSEVTHTGFSNPMSRKNWQGIATRDNVQLKFHESEVAARKALGE